MQNSRFGRSLVVVPVVAVLLGAPGCRGDAASRRLDAGDAFYEAGNLHAALEAYREIAQRDPENHRAHYSVGLVRYALDDYPGTVEALDGALALQPERADYLYLRGNALIRLRRFDEAIRDYEAAVTADPTFGQGLYALGLAHYNAGDYGEAARWLKRYLRVARSPDNEESVRELIRFLEEG